MMNMKLLSVLTSPSIYKVINIENIAIHIEDLLYNTYYKEN